jgi:hypothetical protein
MALDTYANLQTAIADFLNRDDLTATIPDFITLAEAQMQRDIEHWRMEKRSEVALTDRYTALPDDFVKPLRLYVVGANRALTPITQSEMQDKRYSNADAAGTECFYSITAGEIEIFPSPSSGTLELYYVSKIPVLSDANTTNWLLDEAPGVYLYGALSQSAPYLKDDERLIIWSTLYSNAVNALNQASMDAKWGGQKLKLRTKRNG